MANIALVVSGGIAAYKSIDVLRLLQKRGHDVEVLLTRNATKFVTTGTFAALSGRPVGTSLFGRETQPGYDHLDHARRADLVLVCPATAATLARMAAGMADGLVGTTLLAFDGPVVVAPAMNPNMLRHPATEANLATLTARGVHVVPVAEGVLADGDVGPGRLASPLDICDAVDGVLGQRRSLAALHVVISAGGTQEPVDAVRFVGNRSSGKMGWAVAEEARARGAKVTVLACNVGLPRRDDITYIDTPTAHDLHRATVDAMPSCDILVMAAAVADYRPVHSNEGKIDKSAAGHLTIELEKTVDILTEVTAHRDAQTIVGFAAEHGEAGLQRAREKRTRKGVDILVHNDISRPDVGFGTDDNAITLIGPGASETTLPVMTKRACAAHILDAAQEARSGR